MLTQDIARRFVAGGDVRLSQFQIVQADAAEILAAWPDRLDLDGLESLSTEAAAALAKHRHTLSLCGLESLPVESARHLTGHRGGLCLDGLWGLADEAAEHLAAHRGALSLNGLGELGDEVARHLAGHRGPLELDGVMEISDRSAEYLADHVGRIMLHGLYSLSTRAARSLSKRCRGDVAPITSLDDPVHDGENGVCLLLTPALTPTGATVLEECCPDIIVFNSMFERDRDPHNFVCADGHYLCDSPGGIFGIAPDEASRLIPAIEQCGDRGHVFASTVEIAAAYGRYNIRLVTIDSTEDGDDGEWDEWD